MGIMPVGVGASKPYAIIGVTYPFGSTCTCTNGTRTLTAKDTTGKALFVIPAAGTWTVKAVKGSQSASKAVKITAEGQVATVVLAYEFVIYEAGSFGKNSAGTAFDVGSNDDNNASSITKNSAYMLWKCGAWAVCTFYITPKFSCAGYKTLKISLTNASTVLDSSSKGSWGLKSSNSYDNNDFVAQTNFTSLSGSQTLSLDVSNVGSTAYYIAMYFYTMQNTGSFSARVTKIWLE